MVCRTSAAAVSVREEDELAEGVPIYVELDTDAVGQTLGMADKSAVLGGISSSLASVGLGAGVGGGTAGNTPLVGPVTVDVCSYARSAGASLAVLPPETVIGASVDEA